MSIRLQLLSSITQDIQDILPACPLPYPVVPASDGGMFLSSPVDPLLVLLPILDRARDKVGRSVGAGTRVGGKPTWGGVTSALLEGQGSQLMLWGARTL